MSQPDFPEADASVDSLEPERLRDRIDAGEDVTILDVRAEREADEWRIEGPSVEYVNVPYYEFLEGLEAAPTERVPEGDPLVVVCAKGQASDYVGGLLAEEGRDVVNLAEGMNGWATIYDAAELDADTGATVIQYRRPSSGCLSYLVVDGGEAAVIDPLRAFADRYVADARERGADLLYAVDTHVHADHVSGVRDLAETTGARAFVPAAAEDRGVDYDLDYGRLNDGDALAVGDVEIEAVYTPGHTSGMTSYLVDGAVLLTGDGLFTESVARPDLEEGDEGAPDAAARLYDSLHERVFSLDDDVLVAPAHFSDAATPREDGTYAARLGDLVARMDAVNLPRDEFVEYVLDDMPPRPSNYEDIIATNLGQRDTAPEEAFELELGPNNCAASRDAMTGD